MRAMALLALALAAGVPAAAREHPPSRRVRCCIEVSLPDVSPEPRCLVVHFNLRHRLRVGRRLFCRLAGGRPVVRGKCSCDRAPRGA
jgi:hypothetical protein